MEGQMARKAKTRKLTRRDAVAMLGAGTVLGVARTPLTAAKEVVQPDHPSCDVPAQVATYKRSNNLAIVSVSCCDETKNALLVGVQEPTGTRKPTPRGKTHLKPLEYRLNNDNLLEYCFMMWGISAAQAQQLFETMPKQFDLQVDKRGAAAK
jgi:hypothetical protein